ncbi:MAG: hypothetical protein ACLSGI_00145 [Butyricicoccaceae bacterium]
MAVSTVIWLTRRLAASWRLTRQARAAGQGAGHDVRADSVVELLVEWLLVVRFEMVSQHGRRLLSLRLLQNLC